MFKLIQFRPALAIAAAGALAGALAVAGPAAAVTAAGHARAAGMPAPHRTWHIYRGSGPGHDPRSAVVANWPMFRAGPQHYGVSPETAIGTPTAHSLAARWTAPLGAPSYTSPAVATVGAGRTLVYAGGANHLYAYPAGGGAPAWRFTVASGVVETSPAVFDGVVYAGTTSGTLYAVNAATGALLCRFSTGAPILASPVVTDAANGSGPVVYDGTIPGGGPGAEWAVYGPGNRHGGCTRDWEFTGFALSPGGSWSPPAYATDAHGVPLVVFGSKNPDNSVYAVNANTGALVWRYRTSGEKDADVGAPPTISLPGRNGFAGGVVYVTAKDKVSYALNLTTGALIWKHALATGTNGDLSGTALVGTRVYVGSDTGVYALSAITGAQVWHVLPAVTFFASPAVTGPPGQQVLLIGDFTGHLYALNLATGATMWTRQPSKSGFWGSPAVSHGACYVAGLDGLLRSYAP